VKDKQRPGSIRLDAVGGPSGKVSLSTVHDDGQDCGIFGPHERDEYCPAPSSPSEKPPEPAEGKGEEPNYWMNQHTLMKRVEALRSRESRLEEALRGMVEAFIELRDEAYASLDEDMAQGARLNSVLTRLGELADAKAAAARAALSEGSVRPAGKP
jgi:hypothetical protein